MNLCSAIGIISPGAVPRDAGRTYTPFLMGPIALEKKSRAPFSDVGTKGLARLPTKEDNPHLKPFSRDRNCSCLKVDGFQSDLYDLSDSASGPVD
jgi:hypothetical protein